MSETPSYEENFAYSAPSPRRAGPLRFLTFDLLRASTTLSLSLVDAEQDHRFFAISYAWDKPVCKPVFGVDGSVSCAEAMHGTALWTNNKALCNGYLRDHRSYSDGYVDILINGRKFYIQDTVYHLLQTLQASVEIQQRWQNGQYFWLDAICINQNDKSETEQQASNMHEVYKAAQHVYVWLGKTSYCNKSRAAMDFLYDLSPSKRSRESLPNHRWRAQFHLEDQYWPLYSLFIRPYWRRVWVIQEFLLARDATLLCGDRAVPCHKAELLVSQLDRDHEFRKRHPQWAATPAVKIIQARTAFLSSSVKPPLETMIHHFLFSQSTFPEDKLISLLNVSFSTVQTDFGGESGSVEKRVEVINIILRDSQRKGMNAQTAQELQRLLACLLGVRSKFLESEEKLSPRPQERPNPAPETTLSPWLSLIPSLPRTKGRPATSCPFTEKVVQGEIAVRKYAATSCTVHMVGNVRSVRPVRELDLRISQEIPNLTTRLARARQIPNGPKKDIAEYINDAAY